MTPSGFQPATAAAALLARLGIDAPVALAALPGGRNNKVWRVDVAGGPFLLKQYHWSSDDPRDRLGQEWAFLEYLRAVRCTRAPRPLARDPATHCALLEFIPGAPPSPAEIGPTDIDAAVDFFRAMNTSREQAAALPPVSEACFSLAEHVATTNARVDRLAAIEPQTDIHAEVIRFVAGVLRPRWRDLAARIRRDAGAVFSQVLPCAERCLSPSDFGFHNSLRQADGSLRFLDFEYAGWDDPAKTLADFRNQPDLLLPAPLADRFLSRSLEFLPAPVALVRRLQFLDPLYQLKWACICLNPFLPGRRFDDPRPERSPAAQLARARTMADRASPPPHEE